MEREESYEMEYRQPSDCREFLDEIVEHCYREFNDERQSHSRERWKADVLRMTSPGYEDHVLCAVDGATLAAFVIWNSFGNLGRKARFECELALAASGTLGRPKKGLAHLIFALHGLVKYGKSVSVEGFEHSITGVSPGDVLVCYGVTKLDYRRKGVATEMMCTLRDRFVERGIRLAFFYAVEASAAGGKKNNVESIIYFEPAAKDGSGLRLMAQRLDKEQNL